MMSAIICYTMGSNFYSMQTLGRFKQVSKAYGPLWKEQMTNNNDTCMHSVGVPLLEQQSNMTSIVIVILKSTHFKTKRALFKNILKPHTKEIVNVFCKQMILFKRAN